MDQKELDDWRIKRFAAQYGGKLPAPDTDQPCAHCDTTEGVKMHSSRTNYGWDGKGKDPNAPVPLCDPCAKIHHENWDDLWLEVNG